MKVRPIEAAGVVYIRADGSIDPSTAPVSSIDNVTYTLDGDVVGSIEVERDGIVIDGSGHAILGARDGNGINMVGRSNVTIMNTEIKEFGVHYARPPILYPYGIHLAECSNVKIIGNNLTDNLIAVEIEEGSNDNIVFQNKITVNETVLGSLFYACEGISVVMSSHNNISGNVVTNAAYGGLYFLRAGSNVVRGNTIVGGLYNFNVLAFDDVSEYVNDVDSSNTVDGKPVYYWVGRQDMEVPADAGFVALVNSRNIMVKGLNLTHNFRSVLVVNTTDSVITGNTITYSGTGIHMMSSSNNTVSGNKVAHSPLFADIRLEYSCTNNRIFGNNITEGEVWGILLSDASDNVISGNNIADNIVGINLGNSYGNILSDNNITGNTWQGIDISYSSNNTISGNNITENDDYGILIRGGFSQNNVIYHNSFIDNGQGHVRCETVASNTWDNGYPSGGNYWDDYAGVDLFSGPDQNMTGSDGIGDTPYEISENNIDNHPLMGPYWYWSNPILGDTNRDMKVDMRDLGLIAASFGSNLGDPRWNSNADVTGPGHQAPDGKVDISDIILTASNFGKHYP